MSWISRLFGFDKSEKATPDNPCAPSGPIYLVIYAHESSIGFVQATVGYLNGRYDAVWTINKRPASVQGAGPDEFELLWSELQQLPDLPSSYVNDPSREIDFRKYHILTIMANDESVSHQSRYMVPVDTATDQFILWLRRLGYPQ